MEEIKTRLAAFRAAMKKAGVAAAIIPQTDAHLGEYIADHWQVRRWLSGFTGSAGTLVFAPSETLLWTDSRYFLQATEQLAGTGITLMKEGIPGTPTIAAYLAANLVKGSAVGLDGKLFATTEIVDLRAKLEKHGLRLDTHFDPIDELWADRPELPSAAVFIHEEKFAGRSAADKIRDTLAQAREQGADSMFVSGLDEIAWVLNLRSSDVRRTPVATAFLYLSAKGSTLFIKPEKISREVRAYIDEIGMTVRPYDAALPMLNALPDDALVLIEAPRTSQAVVDALGSRAVFGASPIVALKAVKNQVQIAGIRKAMEHDGAAMTLSLIEIERRMAAGNALTELDIEEILTRHRSAQPYYFDDSFDTIAGYGPHGAIVHYSATPESASRLKPEGLLLIDSGAQYLWGTTDITRTIALGSPTPAEKRDFTLVMKGHIALATAIFPEGTRGGQLDALARQFLWQEGLSYLHGTGHGVGHFLSVHEGPQSIRLNDVPYDLKPGMLTSNEPGLYRAGVHGIRCENLVLTVPAFTTEFGNFYRFETMTLCPFDRSLFDTAMMTRREIEWVNAYHEEVYRRISPLLEEDARAWLAEKTKPLEA
ncbi:MAG: aminopeptidase P family protein [[Clostridium] fimetarium]|nr:aminopeptidase P family protein [Alistipes timonensis]MCM1405996.1 aminopeptidase P family protein [[Clostridium] fimetarium]